MRVWARSSCTREAVCVRVETLFSLAPSLYSSASSSSGVLMQSPLASGVRGKRVKRDEGERDGMRRAGGQAECECTADGTDQHLLSAFPCFQPPAMRCITQRAAPPHLLLHPHERDCRDKDKLFRAATPTTMIRALGPRLLLQWRPVASLNVQR